jgi:hypothetical protein
MNLEKTASSLQYIFLSEIKESKSECILTLSDPMSDLVRHDFPVPNAFPHVVRTLANR